MSYTRTVTWDEFVQAATEISWITYLATADTDGYPHVAPVSAGFTPQTIWFGSNSQSRKISNLRANHSAAFHWPVGTGTGPGELFARGTTHIHESSDSKARLWTEIEFAYDLTTFFQSPENPDLVFVEARISHASLLGADHSKATWPPRG